MYIVGIDIAKRTHVGAIIDDTGKHYGKAFKIDNSVEGFNILLDKNAEISQGKYSLLPATLDFDFRFLIVLSAALFVNGTSKFLAMRSIESISWASLSISASTFPFFFRPRLISVCSGGGISSISESVIFPTA